MKQYINYPKYNDLKSGDDKSTISDFEGFLNL